MVYVRGVIAGQSIERIGCNIVCNDDTACRGEGCVGDGSIGVTTCLLSFSEFQNSLVGAAVFFKVTLPGAVVAFAGVVCRWCGGRFGVWGCLSAVLGVVVCHLAVVAVFPVRLISSPMATASEAMAVAGVIVACACIHGSVEVAIWIADVLCDCCSGGLLLDGGYHLGGLSHEDFDDHRGLIWDGGVDVRAELVVGDLIIRSM